MFNIERMQEPDDLKQEKEKTNANYRTHGVVSYLTHMYNNCYSCNCSLAGGNTIEHIHSQKEHTEEKYEWTNLILCCNKCNNSKRAKSGEVIDPTNETLEIHKLFLYDFSGKVKINIEYILEVTDSNDELYRKLYTKVDNTISYYKLNRKILEYERHEKIMELVNNGKVGKNRHEVYKGLTLSSEKELKRLGVRYE